MAQTRVRPEEKVVITRTFDAPRERVWRAWTVSEEVRRWWGSKGFSAPVVRIDLHVGGQFFNCMRSPEGKDVCGVGTFKEVKPPERFVVTDSFADEKGDIVSASYYGMTPDWPREALITVTFEEVGAKTSMTLAYSGLKGVSEQDREGMRQGWEQSFDKLDEYLKGNQPPDGGRVARLSRGGLGMAYVVDFNNVSTVGLESSPVAKALAGLRANEARYYVKKYQHQFTVVPASESQETLEYVNRILKEERGIELAARPLETSRFQVENTRMAYVFYEDGLVVNVMYAVDDPKKRAVGFKLSEGMGVPKELAKFKFARQKSTLAGTIRGSFFVIKGEY